MATLASSASFWARAPSRTSVDAAVVNLFGGFERLASGFDVGLGFGLVFLNGGAGEDLIGGLRLFVLALAFAGGGGQIAALQFGQQLAGANVIAAIYQHAPHRCADLGGDVGLVDGVENGVGGDHVVDGAADGGFDQDRGGRLGFLFFFLLAAAGEEKRSGQKGEQWCCGAGLWPARQTIVLGGLPYKPGTGRGSAIHDAIPDISRSHRDNVPVRIFRLSRAT